MLKSLMRYRSVLVLLVAAGLFACNKDKFKTEPQVTVKSISPSTVFNGDVITIKGNYTDDEGDVDSLLIAYKWFNGATEIVVDTLRISFNRLNLPAKTRQADLQIQFEYNTNNIPDMVPLPGVSLRDTTASFGLLLKDKAGQRSNYSESDKIRLKRP